MLKERMEYYQISQKVQLLGGDISGWLYGVIVNIEKDLMDKGILKQEISGGCSTNYDLVDF